MSAPRSLGPGRIEGACRRLVRRSLAGLYDARRTVQRLLPSHVLEQDQESLVTMMWLAHSPVTLAVAMSRATKDVIVP